MQQLLEPEAIGADGTLLRELFLQRLPTNVRMVLASSGEATTLEKLAELGDRVVAAASPTVAGVSPSKEQSEVDKLRSEVLRLQETVAALSRPSQPLPHQPPYRNSRQRSPSPYRLPRPHSPPPRPNICWYHARFGERARKCSPPCSYSGNDRASA